MRRLAVNTLTLALVLSGAGVGLAQQQPGQPGGPPRQPGQPGGGMPGKKAAPSKSKLEEMLAEALKNNPDIRVAAAKLAEADAELNRTRLQVMQKVVTLYHAIETQKKTVARWESEAKRLRKEVERAIVDPAVIIETENQLALAKGKLEELEAQLPALLGKSARAEIDVSLQDTLVRRLAVNALYGLDASVSAEWEKRHKATGPMSDKIRKALSRPISVSFDNRPVKEVADALGKDSGLVLQFVEDPSFDREETVAIRCDNVSLGAVLQLLDDSLPRHTIVVRDYGLLIAPKRSVPPGALSVQEFLRPSAADGMAITFTNPDPFSSLPWKVPDKIGGTIKKINPDGSIYMSLNSVDGLLNGHALHVYRPSDDSSKVRYLGTIRISYVDPNGEQGNKEVRGQAVGRLSEPPKIGDKVSARMPSGGKNPPAESVEGVIKSVDKDGLLTISIGSDAGLAKGQTLELFWMPHKPPINDARSFGTVRVLETKANESVVQPIGRLSHQPNTGDRIIGHIQKK